MINRVPAKRYVTRWQEFRFLPGTLRALRRLRRNGCRAVILSNQAGVGRRIMRRSELDRITRRMRAAILRAGGRVEAVYYCTHRPETGCRCRKPRPGLLRRACRELGIDSSRSWLVGDNATDIQMGRGAGCRTVLVLTGASTRGDARRMAVRPDRVARDLTQAVAWILRQKGRP